LSFEPGQGTYRREVTSPPAEGAYSEILSPHEKRYMKEGDTVRIKIGILFPPRRVLEQIICTS
jgi:hypothetical protein